MFSWLPSDKALQLLRVNDAFVNGQDGSKFEHCKVNVYFRIIMIMFPSINSILLELNNDWKVHAP